MRVALFHNLPPGGARRAAYELAKRSADDIRYDLFGFQLGAADRFEVDPQRDAQDLASLCKEVYLEPVGRGLHRRGVPVDVARAIDIVNVERAAGRLAAAINAGDYDLILGHHCQLMHAPPILGRVAAPFVYFMQEPRRQTFEFNLSRRRQHPKGFVPRVLSPFERAFDRWVGERDLQRARAATTIVVNSVHSLEYAYRAYGRHTRPSHLGVDGDVFVIGPEQARRGVLSVGSLHPLKGHELCIRELGRLPKSDRPPLTIVYERGTHDERTHLEHVARECGVVLEFRRGVADEELVSIYQHSIALMCAATVEPFGLTTIEALACGTPVVAVAEGGYREVVRDGENGVLVDRRPGQLADGVRRVMTGELRFDPGALRTSVLPYFSWEEAARRFDEILRSTAAGERLLP